VTEIVDAPGHAEAAAGRGSRPRILTTIMMIVSIVMMTKRITANLPEGLLAEATRVTGKGITDTLIAGLELVRRSRVAAKAAALRGKIRLDVDLERSRERRHR
jgi:hypothetical protein